MEKLEALNRATELALENARLERRIKELEQQNHDLDMAFKGADDHRMRLGRAVLVRGLGSEEQAARVKELEAENAKLNARNALLHRILRDAFEDVPGWIEMARHAFASCDRSPEGVETHSGSVEDESAAPHSGETPNPPPPAVEGQG